MIQGYTKKLYFHKDRSVELSNIPLSAKEPWCSSKKWNSDMKLLIPCGV